MFVPIFIPYKTSEDYYYESLTTEEKKKYLDYKAELEAAGWKRCWNGTKYDKYLDMAIKERLHGNEKLAKRYQKLSDFWFWTSLIFRFMLSSLVVGLPLVGVFVLSFYSLEHIGFSPTLLVTIASIIVYAIFETTFGLKLHDWIWTSKKSRKDV